MRPGGKIESGVMRENRFVFSAREKECKRELTGDEAAYGRRRRQSRWEGGRGRGEALESSSGGGGGPAVCSPRGSAVNRLLYFF